MRKLQKTILYSLLCLGLVISSLTFNVNAATTTIDSATKTNVDKVISYASQLREANTAGKTSGKFTWDTESKSYSWTYFNGLMLDAFNMVGNSEDLSFTDSFYNANINSDGTIANIKSGSASSVALDSVEPIRAVFDVLETSSNASKYKKGIQTIYTMVENQTKYSNCGGNICHKMNDSGWATYPIALDGLYMAEPFLMECANAIDEGILTLTSTSNTTVTSSSIYSDVYNRMVWIYNNMYDSSTHLYNHAYSPSSGKTNGIAWSRSIGWYVMALVDIIEMMPEDTTDCTYKSDLKAELPRIFDGLLQYQDSSTGMWYNVTAYNPTYNDEKVSGNELETSGTSMFAYAMIKAYQNGYVTDSKYYDAGVKAFNGVVNNKMTGSSGSYSVSGTYLKSGAGTTASYYTQYSYTTNEAKGVGALIMTAALLQNATVSDSSSGGNSGGDSGGDSGGSEETTTTTYQYQLATEIVSGKSYILASSKSGSASIFAWSGSGTTQTFYTGSVSTDTNGKTILKSSDVTSNENNCLWTFTVNSSDSTQYGVTSAASSSLYLCISPNNTSSYLNQSTTWYVTPTKQDDGGYILSRTSSSQNKDYYFNFDTTIASATSDFVYLYEKVEADEGGGEEETVETIQLQSANTDQVVIDYGKPIKINVYANDSNTNVVQGTTTTAITTYFSAEQVVGFVDGVEDATVISSTKPDCSTELSTSYGTFTIDTSSTTNTTYTTKNDVKYQPKKMLDNIDTIYTVVECTKGTSKYYIYEKLEVMPATIMYYETDFSTTSGISVNSAFSPKTDSLTHIAYQDDGTVGNGQVYGYDSSYVNDLQYSNGSSYWINRDGVTNMSLGNAASFTFKGTGFDLISRTGTNQGIIRVTVYQHGDTHDSTTLVTRMSVCSKSDVEDGSFDLYQIPVASIDGLDYGNYDVVIDVYCAGTTAGIERGGEFYFDAIRIYNPMGSKVKSSTEESKVYTEENTIVSGAYTTDLEESMTLTELRDKLIFADADITHTAGTDETTTVETKVYKKVELSSLDSFDASKNYIIATAPNSSNQVTILGSSANGTLTVSEGILSTDGSIITLDTDNNQIINSNYLWSFSGSGTSYTVQNVGTTGKYIYLSGNSTSNGAVISSESRTVDLTLNSDQSLTFSRVASKTTFYLDLVNRASAKSTSTNTSLYLYQEGTISTTVESTGEDPTTEYTEDGEDGVLLVDRDKAYVSLATYATIGPNNEIYLTNKESLAFALVLGSNTGSVDLGLKCVTGGTSVQITILNSSGTQLDQFTKTISSTTVQFYDLLNGKSYAGQTVHVLIKNLNSTNALSITDLKTTGDTVTIKSSQTAAQYGVAEITRTEEETYDIRSVSVPSSSVRKQELVMKIVTTGDVDYLKILRGKKEQTFTATYEYQTANIKLWTVTLIPQTIGIYNYVIQAYGADGETGASAKVKVKVTLK